MEDKVKKCFTIEKNDCIYIVTMDDEDSNERQPYLEDNKNNFYEVGEIDCELESNIHDVIPAEKEVNPTDGTIVYELSEEEFLADPYFIENQSLIRIHESTDSTATNQFVCLQCHKTFNRQYSLKVHMRVHTGEKPYKCTYDCPKSFATSGDLQRHVRTHTGEKPYKCSFEGCGISFTTKANLRIHFRQHTGERPYKCNFEGCQKTFIKLTNFKNHERIHTGEKPYECDTCKKTFREYATLYRHKLIHKGKEHYVYLEFN